ncbi:MAG: hypothetical protein FH749_02265 [Firmicutes bacterium]|nr:hypothetical protein [Bacillota bacterium]
MKKTILLALIMVFLLTGTALAASGDIVRISGNVNILAGEVVDGDVVVIMGNVTVDGQVNGDVVTIVGKTILGPEGSIQGDAVSIIGGVDADNHSAVNGSVVSLIGSSNRYNLSWREMPAQFGRVNRYIPSNPFQGTMGLLMGLLVAVFIAAVFPKALGRVQVAIQTRTGASLGYGLLAWIVAIPVMIIAAITIIGIPLAILVGIGLWVAVQFGYAALAMLVGTALLRQNQQPVATVAVGAVLIGALRLLPVPGIGVVTFILGILAVGATIASRSQPAGPVPAGPAE